ncbi:MAG: beta/alpha barrel domain-containing protein [Chloroflexota bacterium]
MDLIEAIRQSRRQGKAPVVAEIKRRIPRLATGGGESDRRDAAELARLYESGGACGLSLVTEKAHFGGRPEEDVPAVLRASQLPLLIKDFITDEPRIDYYLDLIARSGTARPQRVALLLIAHRLGAELPRLLAYVRASGCLALVETRGPRDLAFAAGKADPPRLVGLNNKDIDDLERGPDEIRLTAEVAGEYRRRLSRAVLVSQSAHHSPMDVRRSVAAGADAVLVGTAFMLAPEPAATVAAFVGCLEQSR